MKKLLLGLLLISGTAFANVTVYTQTKCTPCHELKAYLKAHSIPFTECNINTSKQCMADMVKNGWQVTPVTVVNGKVVIGPNGKAIENYYRSK